MIKILKEKKGVPTLIEYNGKKYTLHEGAKKPKKPHTPKEVKE